MTKRARIFAFVVTVMVIATATLTPGTQGLHPAASISGRIRRFLMDAGLPYRLGPLGFEFLANIVMFIPLGAFLGVLWWRRWRGLLFAVPPLASLGIETFQFLFLPHRGPQFEDIIANSVGGWIGLALFLILKAGFSKWLGLPLPSTVGDTGAEGNGPSAKAAVGSNQAADRPVRAPVVSDSVAALDCLAVRDSAAADGPGADKSSQSTAIAIGFDAAAWGGAILLTGLLIFNFQGGRVPWRGESLLWLLVIALQVVIGWLLQVYPPGRLSPWESTTSLIALTLGVGTIVWLATLLFGAAYGIPRSLMFAATPIALAGALAARRVADAVASERQSNRPREQDPLEL